MCSSLKTLRSKYIVKKQYNSFSGPLTESFFAYGLETLKLEFAEDLHTYFYIFATENVLFDQISQLLYNCNFSRSEHIAYRVYTYLLYISYSFYQFSLICQHYFCKKQEEIFYSTYAI